MFGLDDVANSHVYISDKNSRRHKEARIVPIVPTLQQALASNRSLAHEKRYGMVLKGFSNEAGAGDFFLIDVDDKCLIPVAAFNSDRLLAESMAGSAYFFDIKNGFRHFLLTRLNHVSVPQPLIDLISGHRHAGTEPEFLASPMSWLGVAEYLRQVIEKEVVAHLGLEVPFER